MARRAQGTVLIVALADGTRRYRLRFRAHGQRHDVYLHERRDCPCGCGGAWDQRSARIELDNILARVRAGVWTPPARPSASLPPAVAPTFHEYASRWLQRKRDGVLGERAISDATYRDYLWRLRVHLLPYFATCPVDEIDRQLCLAFKEHKLREAAQLRDALAAGADLCDRRGRRIRPLGAASIKKLLDALKAILDEAVEDGYLPTNPARSRRMRVRVPKPSRTFLEIDELVALEDAARHQDPRISPQARHVAQQRPHTTAGRVAARAIAGMRPAQIASDLGLAKSTVTYHLDRLDIPQANDYLGRGAIITTLGRSGVRVSELCDMRIGHLRLHDSAGARFHIPDAKTQAGIREVQMSPSSQKRSFFTSTTCAARITRPAPMRGCFPTAAADASPANASRRSSPKPPPTPRSALRRVACRHCRPRHRTRCDAPTSRSRCWPTTSTSSGSCTRSATPTPK